MKRMTFYADSNRSGDVFRVETDGAVLDIHVDLHDDQGRQVTRFDITPDRDRYAGANWQILEGDRPGVVRVVNLAEPAK